MAETPPLPRIFALADTHLPGGARNRSMDRFGSRWWRHRETLLKRIWQTVRADDILLLPGDLSWATRRRDVGADLAFLAALPGTKICVKGNHDFWWESEKPLGYPGLLEPPFVFGDGALGIAGTRGWQIPRPGTETEVKDTQILERERGRLLESLGAIKHCERKIVMTHYPPQPYLKEISESGARVAVYGHVHVGSLPHDEILAVFGETFDGVTLYCVACDRINFTPVQVNRQA